MKKCKVCLKEIEKGQKYSDYHDHCFRTVFTTIKIKDELPFTRKEFKTDRATRNNKKFSISGVQPKLLISIQEDHLEVTEMGGTHIIKVSPEEFPYAAENEHLTMEIIRTFGIETALCSLMKMSDGELVYITKRFDRDGDKKIHQEDMMQAMGIQASGDSKYESKSYEDVGKFLYEKSKNKIIIGDFFKRVVINFLLGNDDFHLKNISIRPEVILEHKNGLTPLYDSLNIDIYKEKLASGIGELALDLVSNESGTTKHFDQYGYHTMKCFDVFAQRIELNKKFAENFYAKYLDQFEEVLALVENSFLPAEYKEKYCESIKLRKNKFFAPDK